MVVPSRGSGAGLRFSVLFDVDCVVAGEKLAIGGPRASEDDSGGLRAYLAIFGGLPGIPQYLGSKSTSMGTGGYQGRAL